MKMLEAVLRAIDWLSEVSGKIFSWLIGILVLAVTYEIVARYVFKRPTIWAFDIAFMLSGAVMVGALAWTQKERGHVSVDVLYHRFPVRIRLALDVILGLVLSLAWVGAVVWMGFDDARYSWQIRERTSSMFAAPMFPFRVMMPIGFGLLWLQCLGKFIRDLMALTKGGGSHGT